MTYADWIARYDTLTPDRRDELRREVQELSYQPLISILLPVYNADLRFLEEAIASVRRQIYDKWELCIADDASTDRRVRPFLEEVGRSDKRIKLLFRERERPHLCLLEFGADSGQRRVVRTARSR